jgi:hypothetical protein
MSAWSHRPRGQRVVGAAFALSLGCLLGWIDSASAQTPARAVPAEPAEALREHAQMIAESILARIDENPDLILLGDLKSGLREAELGRKMSESTLQSRTTLLGGYRVGWHPYPPEFNAADRELVLAIADLARARARKESSDRMLANGTISAKEHQAEVVASERAEASSAAAQAKRESLDTAMAAEEAADRAADVEHARDLREKSKAKETAAKTKLAALEYWLREQPPAPAELRILVLIDLGVQLEKDGLSQSARAKFEDAIRSWRSDTDRRGALKYKHVPRSALQSVVNSSEASDDLLAMIAESIMQRIDEAPHLIDKQTTLKIAERKAEAELKQATLTLEVAKISLHEFSDETFHIREARTEPKEIASLNAGIKLAEESLRRCESQWNEAKTKALALEQRLKEKSPTPADAQILALIEDAGQLEVKGRLEAARAKAGEAIRLWHAEKERRGAPKYDDVMRRVRQAVVELKGTSARR